MSGAANAPITPGSNGGSLQIFSLQSQPSFQAQDARMGSAASQAIPFSQPNSPPRPNTPVQQSLSDGDSYSPCVYSRSVFNADKAEEQSCTVTVSTDGDNGNDLDKVEKNQIIGGPVGISNPATVSEIQMKQDPAKKKCCWIFRRCFCLDS